MACIFDAVFTETDGCSCCGIYQYSHSASVTQRRTNLLVLPRNGKFF